MERKRRHVEDIDDRMSLVEALKKYETIPAVAKAFSVSRQTVYSRLERFGISLQRPRCGECGRLKPGPRVPV